MESLDDRTDRPSRTSAFETRHRWTWWAVGLLVVALIAALVVVGRAARHAEAEARRAQIVQGFLVDMFRVGDPGRAQGAPQDEMSARELLDRNASRIPADFADQPDVQIDLLEVTASMYRALGDEERARAQQQLRGELIRAHHGEAHPAIVETLLDDAQHALERDDATESLRILDHADPLIHRAGLDHGALRARWWLLRAQATRTDPREDSQQALQNALEAFKKYAPGDPGHAQALAVQAARLRATNLAHAEDLYAKAIDLSESRPAGHDIEQAQRNFLGLAGVREDLGDYAGARQAYERLFDLARRAGSESDEKGWVPTAELAWMLHRFGERERANALFTRLQESIPAGQAASPEAVAARELYADRLVAEGRAVEAIAILEQTRQVETGQPVSDDELPRDGLVLAVAYARADRPILARPLFKAVLDERVARNGEDSQEAMIARVRWAEFLLAQDEIVEAQKQFRQVVALAGTRRYDSVALAHAGLARVATVFGDTDEALAQSRTAVEVLDRAAGILDVRAGPSVWLAYSESHRARGERAWARDWAQRALDASRRYDAPSSRSIAQAEAALKAADAP